MKQRRRVLLIILLVWCGLVFICRLTRLADPHACHNPLSNRVLTIEPEEVDKIRLTSQGRTIEYSGAEAEALIEQLNTVRSHGCYLRLLRRTGSDQFLTIFPKDPEAELSHYVFSRSHIQVGDVLFFTRAPVFSQLIDEMAQIPYLAKVPGVFTPGTLFFPPRIDLS